MKKYSHQHQQGGLLKGGRHLRRAKFQLYGKSMGKIFWRESGQSRNIPTGDPGTVVPIDGAAKVRTIVEHGFGFGGVWLKKFIFQISPHTFCSSTGTMVEAIIEVGRAILIFGRNLRVDPEWEAMPEVRPGGSPRSGRSGSGTNWSEIRRGPPEMGTFRDGLRPFKIAMAAIEQICSRTHASQRPEKCHF